MPIGEGELIIAYHAISRRLALQGTHPEVRLQEFWGTVSVNARSVPGPKVPGGAFTYWSLL